MKRLISVLLILVCLGLTACGPDYESDAAVLDFHQDCIEHLVDSELLLFDGVFNDEWMQKAFVESWVKVKEVNGDPDILDIECYLHLKVHNGLVTNDRYFHIHIYYSDDGELTEEVDVKEVTKFVATTNTLLGYKYTDIIDKTWE